MKGLSSILSVTLEPHKTPLTLPQLSYSLRCNILFSHHLYLKRTPAQHTPDQSGLSKISPCSSLREFSYMLI